MENRKAFKFYKSYYDVALELPDKDRYEFIMALLEVQFTGHHRQLKGLAKFAFISQKHSINAQIEGYLTKTGASIPPIKGALLEEQEQEQEQVEEENKNELIVLPFSSDLFMNAWSEWKTHRREIKQKLTPTTEKKQIQFLSKFSEKDAIAIINQSITNGWTGLFEIKNGSAVKSKFISKPKV